MSHNKSLERKLDLLENTINYLMENKGSDKVSISFGFEMFIRKGKQQFTLDNLTLS